MASDAPTVKVDLNKTRALAVMSQDDLMDMLRSGEVVAIDKKSGKYLSEVLGVPLPPVEKAIEKALAKGASKIM